MIETFKCISVDILTGHGVLYFNKHGLCILEIDCHFLAVTQTITVEVEIMQTITYVINLTGGIVPMDLIANSIINVPSVANGAMVHLIVGSASNCRKATGHE